MAIQINCVVDGINQLSPELYQILAESEIFVISQAAAAIRDSACRFAIALTVVPGPARPLTIWARGRTVAAQVDLIYHPQG